MKTVKKGFSRGLSVLLTLVMVLSLTVVGMVSTSAARVDIADSGWYSGDKFYVNANINSYNDIDPMTFVSEGSSNDNGYFTQTFTTTQKYFEFRVKLNGGTYLVPKQSPYEIAPTENTEGSLWTQTDTRGNHDGRIYKLNCSSIKSDKIDVTINVKISGGSVKDLTYKVVSSGGSGGGETTTMRTFTAGEMLYIVNGKPADSWGANWVASDANVKITLINSKTQASTTTENVTLVSGDAYTAGAVYGAAVPTGGEYDQIQITRYATKDSHSTGTMTLSANDNYNCFADFTVNGKTYKGSVYDPSVVVVSGFYVDMTPDDDTFTDDHIKPTVSGSNYTLYLPSGIDRSAVTIVHGYNSLTIGGKSITSGQEVDLSRDSYDLGGSVTGTLRVYKSKNVSSIHTTTGIPMPQGINMNNPVTNKPYDNKENYSTSGTIVVFDKDGKQLNTDINLKKIKGRGNSSWEASYKLTGKYAFNITLAAKAQLLDESAAAKKYCLVSYNADEARMRNMVIYELAQQIGLMFSPDYEPVDLYNNGIYVGSYLLTDKVEIGNPLVDIVNLDKKNEDVNLEIYDASDITSYRGSSNNNLNDKSTKGYKKWVNMTEIEESVYAESGFLLEFELDERFPDEISGFISDKGQQIVVKYPEYTSKNQIDFISEKWNIAEALMYDKSTTYEALSAVIDVESFARMYLIQEFTKNLDGCATSYYVYYDEGRFHAGPVWDYDWTLGQYANDNSGKLNSSSVHSPRSGNLTSTEGWFINSKNIYGAGTLNAQAALCQNKAFWGAVKAEWNESFYDAVSAFTTGTVSATNGLTGTLAEFYEQVKYSTAMDEAKWGIIAADKMASWGSNDTGDSHDAATVYLNNWIYNRLQWMDQYLGRTQSQNKDDFYKTDYTIQPPKVTADKAEYNLGDPVVLTIDDVTGGAYTYTIYKDGVQIATSQEGPTFATTADGSGAVNYTVVATSKGWSGYSSEASTPATVTVGGFQAAITGVEIPQSAMVGETVTVKVTSNAAEGDDVTYTLKDSTGKDIAASNSTGEFTFKVTEAMISENYKVTVGLSVTPSGGAETNDSRDLSINISDYTMTLTLSAPGSAEVGTVVEIKASANTTKPVTYTLYGSDDTTVLDTNSTGIFKVNVGETANVTLTYNVKAQLDSDASKSAEKTVSIKVTAVSETYKVVLYFKSSDSLGYIPQLTTTGATENTDGALMKRDEFICKNVSKTASYSWYTSGELEVSKAKDRLIVNIVSSRYAMEGELTLTPSSYSPNADGVIEIYLACDNLNYNAGGEIRDLTSWSKEKRNWTQSAANMIYDEKEVSAATYAAVASMIAPRYIGDVNNDGVVNVKDATLLQKSIAGTATLDADSRYISDVFYDGTISVKDATAIQKRVVNL